jgi:hypothetical protein
MSEHTYWRPGINPRSLILPHTPRWSTAGWVRQHNSRDMFWPILVRTSKVIAKIIQLEEWTIVIKIGRNFGKPGLDVLSLNPVFMCSYRGREIVLKKSGFAWAWRTSILEGLRWLHKVEKGAKYVLLDASAARTNSRYCTDAVSVWQLLPSRCLTRRDFCSFSTLPSVKRHRNDCAGVEVNASAFSTLASVKRQRNQCASVSLVDHSDQKGQCLIFAIFAIFLRPYLIILIPLSELYWTTIWFTASYDYF